VRQLLDIRPVNINLEYSYPLGQYKMHSPPAEITINRELPELSIKTDPIKVKIDYTDSNESLGIYSPVAFSEKSAQEGKQVMLEVTSQIGEDAKALTDAIGTQAKGNVWADICKRKMNEGDVELECAWVPRAPEISWEGGKSPEISFTPFKMDISWKVHLVPEIEYERGKSQFNVTQWNKVNIAYLGTDEDVRLIGTGKNLSFKV